MKVLLINGSPNEKGCTHAALTEVCGALHRHGIGTEILHLGRGPVQGCIACRNCLRTGRCTFEDGVNALADRLETIDALVAGSPVYYAGPSGQLVSFLDRLFYSAGGRMDGKPGAAVVSCRRGGAASAYDQIHKYFAICSMPIVTSQYWNQVHGRIPEDVAQDEEGLQTMRTLGENLAWLLACIEAGRRAGVPAPLREARKITNFIR